MSRPEDDREGLSPPAANILDLFEDEEEESDDIFEPASEDSEFGTTTNEEESDIDFAGKGVI
jgi:hypothetical protein